MFPSNSFAEPIPPSSVQELYWRAEIFGGDAAGLPPHIEQQWGGTLGGLRDVYPEGLAIVDEVAQAQAGASFVDLTTELQDGLLDLLDQPGVFPADPVRGRTFLEVVIRHTIEGCFSAPEYGGNDGGAGWRMIGIEGDSQPLGYSLYRAPTDALVERPDHPLSTPNPDEVAKDGSLAPQPRIDHRRPRQSRAGSFRRLRDRKRRGRRHGGPRACRRRQERAGARSQPQCVSRARSAGRDSAAAALERRSEVRARGSGASANFADWPFSYADLEPFYVEAERLCGVAGTDDNPFASWRSAPYPMPPGNPMYHSLLLAEGARITPFEGGFLHPHSYPGAINSRPHDGRPACNDCGPCSGFGCPSHAKGSPAVTALRSALLTGRCQVRYNARALWLANDGGHVGSVLSRDDLGTLHNAQADAYVLAASPIESARTRPHRSPTQAAASTTSTTSMPATAASSRPRAATTQR